MASSAGVLKANSRVTHSSPAAVASATRTRPITLAHGAAALAVVLLGALAVPLALRPLNRLAVGAPSGFGYLPALELRRARKPFNPEPIEALRYGVPTWVFIGDSMLGTRIDPLRLGQISSTHDETVAFLFHAATGPAWWYLSFKNHLVASGIKPRTVFVFFRDTNLTDTLFRLESLYGTALDEVALDREPELDAAVAQSKRGAWSRVHTLVNGVYEADLVTGWMEPAIRRWFVNARYPDPVARMRFDQMLDERFSLAQLRTDVAADLSAANDGADFDRDLPRSVLPPMLQLAREHGITLCFVRVQRRPAGGTPPPQPDTLKRYVASLKAWLEANGALFHDDWGDPALTEDMYADGDHVGDRRRYTDNFRKRLDPLFR